MSTAIKSGILLGLLVEIWTAVVILAGWHKDPAMMLVFFLVIPLQITIVILALRRTAGESGYGRQVMNGLVLSIVAAVIIVLGSYVITTSVFPNYFDEIKTAGAEILAKAGRTPEQIAEEMRKNESMYDPMGNAMTGGIATVVTGLLVSLVAAFFIRKR